MQKNFIWENEFVKKGDNIRLRKDGRYEARYIKGRDASEKIIYGYCYGRTYEEAKEKRDLQLKRMVSPKELKLLILGAGSHGHDVYEIAKNIRIFSDIAFLDDDLSKRNVIGKWNEVDDFLEKYPLAIVAVGDEEIRRVWTEKLICLGYIIPTLVHPTAFVAEDAEIGIGTVICARVTIASGVKIGKGCIVTSGSIIPRKLQIPNWGYYEFNKILHYKEEYCVVQEGD